MIGFTTVDALLVINLFQGGRDSGVGAHNLRWMGSGSVNLFLFPEVRGENQGPLSLLP